MRVWLIFVIFIGGCNTSKRTPQLTHTSPVLYEPASYEPQLTAEQKQLYTGVIKTYESAWLAAGLGPIPPAQDGGPVRIRVFDGDDAGYSYNGEPVFLLPANSVSPGNLGGTNGSLLDTIRGNYSELPTIPHELGHLLAGVRYGHLDVNHQAPLWCEVEEVGDKIRLQIARAHGAITYSYPGMKFCKHGK